MGVLLVAAPRKRQTSCKMAHTSSSTLVPAASEPEAILSLLAPPPSRKAAVPSILVPPAAVSR